MPDLSPPPGWEPLPTFPWRATTWSFVSDEPHGQRIRLRCYIREGDLLARVWFGPLAEGPPGHTHGGALAAVHDECMGSCAHHAGHLVVLANMNVRYRAATPLRTVLTLHASMTTVAGRKVHAESRMVDDSGTIYSEGEGLFVALDARRFETLAAKRTAT